MNKSSPKKNRTSLSSIHRAEWRPSIPVKVISIANYEVSKFLKWKGVRKSSARYDSIL
jgi:hypothetical protein